MTRNKTQNDYDGKHGSKETQKDYKNKEKERQHSEEGPREDILHVFVQGPGVS